MSLFAPGVIDNLPMDDYHASAALSSSGIKKLLRSPAHYVVERTQSRAPTDAMRIGTAVHTLLLEPERSGEVVQMPTFNLRTNAGKADRDAWLAEHPGAQAFALPDYERICGAVEAVRRHPAAGMLLSEGKAETSLFWRDAATRIECRARFDWYRPADGIIADVKTCQDASPEGFQRAIGAFSYHVSAAHYWLGHEHLMDRSPAAWLFICVEVEPPFGVAVYALESDALRAGMDQCARAYKTFRQCVESGSWPAYPNTIEPISAPRWALIKQGE